MDVGQSLGRVAGALGAAGLRHALVGGMALAFRGVQRATLDLDFIVLAEDGDGVAGVLGSLGYAEGGRSAHAATYVHQEGREVRVDVLFARSELGRGMVERAERVRLEDSLHLPIAAAEDLIGLKLQAVRNDPARMLSDWGDISALVDACGRKGQALDLRRLRSYFELFGFADKFGLLFPEEPR